MMKHTNVKKEDRQSIAPVLILVGGIFTILIGGMLTAMWMDSRKREDEGENPTINSSIKLSSEGFKCISQNYPLEFGTCHKDVMILQHHLKKLGADLGSTGYNKDGIDGRFGAKTRIAAKKYLDKDSFKQEDIKKLHKQTQTT